MDERGRRFEQLVAPHLGAAFNFARWLTHNDHDAQDIVQDASLRALRFLDGLRGEDARPWLLGIVRNATWSWLQANRPSELTAREDDGEGPTLPPFAVSSGASAPEQRGEPVRCVVSARSVAGIERDLLVPEIVALTECAAQHFLPASRH